MDKRGEMAKITQVFRDLVVQWCVDQCRYPTLVCDKRKRVPMLERKIFLKFLLYIVLPLQ